MLQKLRLGFVARVFSYRFYLLALQIIITAKHRSAASLLRLVLMHSEAASSEFSLQAAISQQQAEA
jgi:hypothetical protein